MPVGVDASPELVELLDRELSLWERRLRGFPPARYAAAAPFGTKADVAWHLAAQLVAAVLPDVPRALPKLPVVALPDVIAVTGHDLLDAVRVGGVDELRAAAALAEVLLHRSDLDGSLPGPRAAAVTLRVLDPDSAPSPERLLVVARRRCPAYAGVG